MASITLKGNPINTSGELPGVGSKAPEFSLTKKDLSDVSLSDFSGKKVVLNMFPSLDTPVCANSVRRFNEDAANRKGTVVLCISADLPFAHARFCEAEGIANVESLSTMRSADFGTSYGNVIVDGPLKGLLSRSVMVLDSDGSVAYTEQVPEIVDEPNYEAALAALDRAG